MKLRPSEIFYSQDSIGNCFNGNSAHGCQRIGETLDDICEGRCDIEDIPVISVAWIDDKWITCDNRRLWVFRNLENLGKCGKIHVHEINDIPPNKLTSDNGGVDIRVRGNPEGYWYKKVDDSSESSEDDNTSDDDDCTSDTFSFTDDSADDEDSDGYESLLHPFGSLKFN